MENREIVVIGAGISGLTAAYYLKKAGHRVKVLEANQFPGGRMITIHWQGFRIDPGASFLTSKDHFVFKLLEELGIQDQVVSYKKDEVGFTVNIMRDNIQRSVNFMSLPSYLRWSGVSLAARMSILKFLMHMMRYYKLDPYHPELLKGKDNVNMEDFFKRHVHQEMFDYWVQPTMDVMCSYLPSDYSEKMLLLSYVNYLSTKTISFKEGIGYLPDLLAAQLDVEYDAHVSNIDYNRPNSLTKITYKSSGINKSIETDKVIVAITGDEVIDLFSDPQPAWKTFFPQVHYTSSAKLFMYLEGDEPALDHGGCFFPRKEPWKVAAVGWERQPDGRIRGMGALKADYYRPEMTDNEFTDLVLKDAYRFEPALEGHIKDTMVYRWPQKVPAFRPGYLDALKVFKADPQESPVYFCGDYLVMGSAGSALASGQECAERIINSLS